MKNDRRKIVIESFEPIESKHRTNSFPIQKILRTFLHLHVALRIVHKYMNPNDDIYEKS